MAEGTITKEERDALIYNVYTRSLEEMLAPMEGPLQNVFEVRFLLPLPVRAWQFGVH